MPTAEPTVLPLHDRTAPAVGEVLATVAEPHRRLDRWILEAEVVHGAVFGDELVGIGARSSSWVHPMRDWISIHVHPSHRRSGAGTALLAALRAQQAERPLKVRIPSGERAGLRFAAQHGFTRLVSSADVVIRELPVQVVPAGIELVDVQRDDPTFLRALGDLYAASHGWDPCRYLEVAEVRRLLAGDDVLPGSPRLARRSGEVVGVGLAYAGAATAPVEMACIGALDPDAADAVAITSALLESVARPFLGRRLAIAVECDFGPGANSGLSQVLDDLVGRPSSCVEILAAPAR